MKRRIKIDVNDKIVGRPIRLNRQVLEVKGDKDYAEVIFFGDWHYGSPQANNKKALAMLDYCKKNKIYVVCMGDLLETATRDSVGGGIYEQVETVESQYEQMLEWMRNISPFLLGMHIGNHEERIFNSTGVNLIKAMCRELKVPYLGHGCWSEFRVENQRYSLYTLHGRTSARFDGTSLQMVERVSHSFDADIVACGHAHKCVSGSVIAQYVDNGLVKEKKKWIIITGSYLSYDGGYYQKTGGQISKLGSPKVKLFSQRHDVNISW